VNYKKMEISVSKKGLYILKNQNIDPKSPLIKTSIEYSSTQLRVDYEIIGKITNYNFPIQTKQQRADKLWLDTCFELFIANKEKQEYWELNISPSTEWNSYYFTKYKKGMKESNMFLTPQIKTSNSKTKYKFSFETIIQKEIPSDKLEINISAILLDKNKKRSFYSINKRYGSPDFHDRAEWV